MARQHPTVTDEELMTGVGHRFHRDYGPVLRAVLLAVDRHNARQVTEIADPARRQL